MIVRPKKSLGQHFLTQPDIAERIANSCNDESFDRIIEVGPGKGMLTQFLIPNHLEKLTVIEIDDESIIYLQQNFPQLKNHLINDDFLQMDLTFFNAEKIAIIGNYPYNISSQIIFKVIENRHLVTCCAGMFQREVALRICASPGNKDYGILSVLTQAFYNCEYLFTVDEHVFHPPPKVKSGVIKIKRNKLNQLDCDEVKFKLVVKTAFNQRRKTMHNALKPINNTGIDFPYKSQRAEELSVAQFVELTNILYPHN